MPTIPDDPGHAEDLVPRPQAADRELIFTETAPNFNSWFAGHIPTISHLTLTRPLAPLECFHFPSLTDLVLTQSAYRLSLSLTQLNDLFAICTVIHSLTLDRVACSWSGSVRDVKVYSESVHKLRVNCGVERSLVAAFTLFHFANLNDLGVEIRFNTDLTRLFGRSPTFAAVTKLQLTGDSNCMGNIGVVLASFPCVTILNLRRAGSTAFTSLVSITTRHMLHGLAPILPRLSTLYIPYQDPWDIRKLVTHYAYMHGSYSASPLRELSQSPILQSPQSYIHTFSPSELTGLHWLHVNVPRFELPLSRPDKIIIGRFYRTGGQHKSD